MSERQDFLLEIGTEELPPKALHSLAIALADGCRSSFAAQKLSYQELDFYATPRRLAIVVQGLVTCQADVRRCRRGPSLAKALDATGQPSAAALGFAKSCGVDYQQLTTLKNADGEWLSYEELVLGRQTQELLADIVQLAVAQLPVPKRMRWGSGDAEFVRPVRWVLMLFGSEVVPASLFGVPAGPYTYGHRFHAPGPVMVPSAGEYVNTLASLAVTVDYAKRYAEIEQQAKQLAEQQGGQALLNPELLAELTAMVEWPEVFVGEIDADYLALPQAVLRAVLESHQKYIPIVNQAGDMLPAFIAVANIKSRAPELVKGGNERVVRARLHDASFFLQQDKARALADYLPALDSIIFQAQLGTMADKSARLCQIANTLMEPIDDTPDILAAVQRAGKLAKCDLLSEMVAEFPELQGLIGGYYATHSGETQEISTAIAEHYLPRFAKDSLPSTLVGQVLAIADRLDTILGLFAVGERPSGSKDPYALRRAALAVLHIIIECKRDIDLLAALEVVAGVLPATTQPAKVIDATYAFIVERLKQYYIEQGIAPQIYMAVTVLNITRPLDIHQRISAVQKFLELPAAGSLIAAHKRITNLLKKIDATQVSDIYTNDLFESASECNLAQCIEQSAKDIAPLLAQQDYAAVLTMLASLREPIDTFFDDVMVMSEVPVVRSNRLALLQSLRSLFLQVADISTLQIPGH